MHTEEVIPNIKSKGAMINVGKFALWTLYIENRHACTKVVQVYQISRYYDLYFLRKILRKVLLKI